MSNTCQFTGMYCNHPYCGPFTISRKIGNELADELTNLMEFYSYNPNGSDYSCCFCRSQANTNNDSVIHSLDCLGQRLHNELFNQR